MLNGTMRHTSGFTIIEVLIVSAIVAAVTGVVAMFSRNLFSLNDFLQQSLSIQRDAEAALRTMVAELRTASPSSIGGYPIESATSTGLAFYANVDADAYKERISYYADGASFKKSVIKPAGNPLTYSTSTAQEFVSTILTGLVTSSSTPIFSYYDKNYAGTTSPLALPINVAAIRLVAISFIIDEDPSRLPPAVVASSQVSIRNLKDN